MIRYAANLTMLFNEVPFLERFQKAAAAGFRAVEFLFLHNVDESAVRAELERHRLELVLLDPEAGDFPAGDRGWATAKTSVPVAPSWTRSTLDQEVARCFPSGL